MTKGERIKQVRKEMNLTQKEFGKKCGLSEAMVRQYELGLRQPKVETLCRIAASLGVGLEAFMSKTEMALFEDMSNLYLDPNSDIEVIESLDEHTPQEKNLMAKFRKLNEKGQKKASDYIDDLTQIPEYKK
ncbi:helix-turn-helix domain-containing protein [Enterocloster bolteae]|jgi:transcriptional regulator with XRE-family HTH domain|uniref:helix-turn-helix domain-containing protein n=1 Tax=Enterocloster bolteae TaxID=208479 RepID=UPI00321FEE06